MQLDSSQEVYFQDDLCESENRTVKAVSKMAAALPPRFQSAFRGHLEQTLNCLRKQMDVGPAAKRSGTRPGPSAHSVLALFEQSLDRRALYHALGKQLDEETHRCIQACIQCHNVCLETFIDCLQRDGKVTEAVRMQLLDCADICQKNASFMLRGSRFVGSENSDPLHSRNSEPPSDSRKR